MVGSMNKVVAENKTMLRMNPLPGREKERAKTACESKKLRKENITGIAIIPRG
jgi:hypothetical protein